MMTHEICAIPNILGVDGCEWRAINRQILINIILHAMQNSYYFFNKYPRRCRE